MQKRISKYLGFTAMFIVDYAIMSLGFFEGGSGIILEIAKIALVVSGAIGMIAALIGFFHLLFASESEKKQKMTMIFLRLTYISPIVLLLGIIFVFND